ncbi:MAG: phosphatase PAP2 family protein [Planctomycetes bacterium]|nr:phosphatase PAP2 family protein [Planctomycetota bacterium]
MPNNRPNNKFSDVEADLLVAVQDLAPQWAAPASRQLSHFGEHGLGWYALAGLGMAANMRGGAGPGEAERRRVGRRQWAAVGVAAFTAHATSVVVKRIVRRQRPIDPRITVGVATPSRLSFPSSHSTSTTAFLTGLARTTGSPLPLLGAPVMMVSRMVLGVHYPTDTLVGAAIGAATAGAVTEIERRTR